MLRYVGSSFSNVSRHFGHAILRDELDIVPEVARRMRVTLGARFSDALHGPGSMLRRTLPV